MKTKAIFLLFILLFGLTFSAEAQCAMCRAVLESDESGQAAKGINNGIIYLMLFPYLLVGGVGYVIYKMRQKAKKEDAAI
ncbi:MAG: hypothetical protein HKN48_01730 [Flavobacteriaceae bacterium]|nr:hypothetical protein [Flavobacteriaceae bacterium]